MRAIDSADDHVQVCRGDSLLDTFRPSSYMCHPRLTTGGGGVLPRSRYCTSGPITMQCWDAMARHQKALSAGVGPVRRGDLLASLRSWSSVGLPLPGLNLRRRLSRSGRRHSVHLANEIQNWVHGIRVLPPLHSYPRMEMGMHDTMQKSSIMLNKVGCNDVC